MAELKIRVQEDKEQRIRGIISMWCDVSFVRQSNSPVVITVIGNTADIDDLRELFKGVEVVG